MRISTASLAAVAALIAPPSVAFEWAAFGTSARYEATEPAPGGGVFNRETGRLQGWRLELRGSAGAWGWLAAAGDDEGLLRYEGRTQLGLPLTTETALRRRQAEATGWRRIALADAVEGRIGLGAGEWRIARAIQPTVISAGLDEALRLRQALLVAGIGWQAAPSWRLQAQARLLRPLQRRLHVDGQFVFEPVTLEPAARTSSAWDAALHWAPQPGWQLELGVHGERLRVGESPGQVVWRRGLPVAEVRFPGSAQRSLRWQFGAAIAL